MGEVAGATSPASSLSGAGLAPGQPRASYGPIGSAAPGSPQSGAGAAAAAKPPAPPPPPSGSFSPAESDRYAGVGFGVAGLLADNLLSHPFAVLRRQCQVNNASYRTHTTPFTLVPVVVTLNRWQGLSSLWKGLGSTLTVRGLSLAAEDLTSKFTPRPKEIDRQSSLRMIGQHLLLKATSAAALTPF